MEAFSQRATGPPGGRTARLKAVSPLGYARVKRPAQSFACIPVELAPWETLELPEPIAEAILERSQGGLARTVNVPVGIRRLWPYQLRVRVSCP
jgi:hypothetical protein